MTLPDLRKLVGEDVVEALRLVDESGQPMEALRSAALSLMSSDPMSFFGNGANRSMVHRAMTPDKREELAERVHLPAANHLGPWCPSADQLSWRRYLGFFGLNYSVSMSIEAEPDTEEVQATHALYSYQRRAVNDVWKTVGTGHGRVVLHMPTGTGKTRTAMHVACRMLNRHPGALIVWLAAGRELLDQAASAFLDAWSRLGDRAVRLCRFWGDHGSPTEVVKDGIVIASFQKMNRFANSDAHGFRHLGQNARLIIVDEAHQGIASTYHDVISRLSNAGSFDAVLGLTATPGRTYADVEADEELSKFFGRRKVTLSVPGRGNPIKYLMDEGYLARPEYRTIGYEPSRDTRSRLASATAGIGDYGDDILSVLADSATRNAAVVEEVRRLVNVGHRRLLVFASAVSQASLTARVLSALGIAAYSIDAKTDWQVRQRILARFQGSARDVMIICNYGVLTSGFDAPGISAVVIARPTRSLVLYSQMVGRATRGERAGGGARCVVATVADTALPGFGDLAEAYSNWEDVWDE